MEYNYLDIQGDRVKIGVYSYWVTGLMLAYVNYQKKVFDHFNVKINQIEYSSVAYCSHGQFLQNISREEDVDYLVFFDIDAIPLRPDFLSILINLIYGRRAIIGIEMKNNYPDPSSPTFPAMPCFVISKGLYTEIGEPTYEILCKDGRRGETVKENTMYDTGQYVAEVCREKGVELNMIKFLHCTIPSDLVPDFPDGRIGGFGAYYEDLVFHNWESRGAHQWELFINKCREVIGEKNGKNNSGNSM